MTIHTSQVTIDQKEISIETGRWAKQAHGSIVYRCGNLTLLATVCAEKEAKEGQDFFPLTVDYREKTYSVGRIPGGYFKRENRPAEHETLTSRLIDRPIRPLFPEGYFAEVQLLITVLSADRNSVVAGHAITAASAALMISDIPFAGPIAGVVVGMVDGKFIADPDEEMMMKSDLDLTVSGSKDAITMIEGGAAELDRSVMVDAISFAHENIKQKLNFQIELAQKAQVVKREVKIQEPDKVLRAEIRKLAFERLVEASQNKDKVKRATDVENVCAQVLDTILKSYDTENPDRKADLIKKETKTYLHDLEYEIVRKKIFDEGVRADGRQLNEIRAISVELDVLPGVHGSAIFTRGQTQSLGVVTLGTASDYQIYDDLAGVHKKHFMLHYNFPPFSTGEVKRISSPGRREIGHGNLAERSLRYVVPSHESFPYVVRVVSEILESNGSSSMASVCSGSLSLMAAGVPVKGAVSGIAMGLIVDDAGKYVILSDIAGLEDHFGDMDFKVAGTRKGITAFQLDIKVNGVSIEILRDALLKADEGRLFILDKMESAITEPRDQISSNAPRITTVQIDPERIGELIGPGGRMIRSIIEKSGAELNVEDTGIVTIAALSEVESDLAKKMINDIFAEVEAGQIYDGVVKKIADFGAFVEIVPGKEGLVHISKLSNDRVNSVRDVVNEGDQLKVIVLGVDRMGRIDLSHKDALPGATPSFSNARPPRSDRPPHGGGRDRHHDRGGRDGGRGDRDRGRPPRR